MNGTGVFRYRDAERTEVVLEPGGVVFPVAEADRYGCVLAEVLPYDAAWTAAWEVARLDRELARLDREAIRPLRAIASGQATADDARTLAALEALADEDRERRRAWTGASGA